VHDEIKAHHACLGRNKLSDRDRLRPIAGRIITKRLKLADVLLSEDGYPDSINGVERNSYPIVDGLPNIQRLMNMRIVVPPS
jgi:hypothetical protein